MEETDAIGSHFVTISAVVWGVTHFQYYLYGHAVIVYTDHTAVKAVLGTPKVFSVVEQVVVLEG